MNLLCCAESTFTRTW